MKIERAIEILDPEHREHYDDLEEVNQACRMGMEALRIMQAVTDQTLVPLSRSLRAAEDMMRREIYLPGHRAAISAAAEVLERLEKLCHETMRGALCDNVLYFEDTRRSGLLEDD